MDCVVMTWLLDIVSPDLEEIVREDPPTARSVWLTLEHQFLDNCEQHALYLDATFRDFVQGGLSITAYCRKFKFMADALGNLGEDIPSLIARLSSVSSAASRSASPPSACTSSMGPRSPLWKPGPTCCLKNSTWLITRRLHPPPSV
jgi:hypothetical protein